MPRNLTIPPRTAAAIANSAEITAADVARAKEAAIRHGAPRVKQLLAVPKADDKKAKA